MINKITILIAILILSNIIDYQNKQYFDKKVTKQEIFMEVETVKNDIKYSQYVIDKLNKQIR